MIINIKQPFPYNPNCFTETTECINLWNIYEKPYMHISFY